MKNFNEILKQAQEIQKKLEQINEELENEEIEGTAQNIVRAVVNGKLEIKSIEILESDLWGIMVDCVFRLFCIAH